MAETIKLGSGHCCACSTVCGHIGPIRLCEMHERIESNRREGLVLTPYADEAMMRGDNEMLRAKADLLEDENRALRARERAVRAIHVRVDGPTWEVQAVDGVYQRVQTGEADFCNACSWAEPTGRFAHAEPWPCPTIAALDAPPQEAET